MQPLTEVLEHAGQLGLGLAVLGAFGGASGTAALGVAGVTRAFRTALMMAGLSLGCGVLALLLGFWGRTADLKGAYLVLASVNPADRPSIIEVSRREAQANVTLGLLVGVPLVALSAAAIAAAFARSDAGATR